jgi:hypothetical protein
MHPVVLRSLHVALLLSFAGCIAGCGSDDEKESEPQGAPGEIRIVRAAGADVPYQFAPNPYGITGGAFLARANLGSSSVVLEPAAEGKICLKGTVEMVPTPADGSHPPYSEYWGVELGFNLNQAASADETTQTKLPWNVPSNVTGFWFTLEGAMIPAMRFKATPTGKDPALEQDSCALVSPTSGARTEVPFSDMYVQCWNGPQGTGTTDTSQGLLDIGLQIAAATNAEYPLDFCLTHVGVVEK